MIVNLGTNIKKLKTGIIENSSCPNCNTKNELIYSVYGGFVKVVIIPSFPVRKIVTVECNNCKKTYKFKDLNKQIKDNFNIEYKKDPIKSPLWQYTGSIILMTLLSFGLYTGIQAKNAEKIFIVNPKKGDVYIVNNNSIYTTLKVNKVVSDSVYVYLNDFSLNGYSGINEIDIDKNYNKIVSFSKLDLKSMYDKNIIYQIDRK